MLARNQGADADAVGREVRVSAKAGYRWTDAVFRSLIAGIEIVHIAGAGHMLHIEKPRLIAPLIENFLSAH